MIFWNWPLKMQRHDSAVVRLYAPRTQWDCNPGMLTSHEALALDGPSWSPLSCRSLPSLPELPCKNTNTPVHSASWETGGVTAGPTGSSQSCWRSRAEQKQKNLFNYGESCGYKSTCVSLNNGSRHSVWVCVHGEEREGWRHSIICDMLVFS